MKISATKTTVVHLLIILILTCMTHGLSLKAQFMIDDFGYIRPELKPTLYKTYFDPFIKSEGHHYNPLDIIFNKFLFSHVPDPSFLKSINLFLFLLNVILLYFLTGSITKNNKIGFLSASLFCCNAMNAEMLAHITYNNSVFLATALLQLSFMIYWHALKIPGPRYSYLFWSYLFFIPALLFVETALLFPLFVTALFLLLPESERKRAATNTIPLWILNIIFFLIWIKMVNPVHLYILKAQHLHFDFFIYTGMFSRLIFWYLQNLLIPTDIVFMRNYKPAEINLWFWNIVFIGLLILTIILIRRWRKGVKSYFLLWFILGFLLLIPACITHAYTMGYVIEPYWFYFPSMAFFILMAIELHQLKSVVNKILWSTLMGSIFVSWILSSLAFHVMAKTEVSYLQYWLRKCPSNVLPASLLSSLYIYEPRFPIPSDLKPSLFHQVDVFVLLEQYYPATRLLERLSQISSDTEIIPPRQYLLAVLYEKIGEINKAQALIKSLSQTNTQTNHYTLWSYQAQRIQSASKALKIIQEGIASTPNNADLIYLQGVLLAQESQFEASKAIIQKATEMFPQDSRFPQLKTEVQKLQNKSRP